ncbi:MAG TPA: cupin, partial [Pseudolabrys sp.]
MAPSSPLTFMFKDDGSVHNNPALPALVYKGGIDLRGQRDPERAIETLFATNGWGRGQWRDGIFPFVHYHSMIH